MKNEEVLNEIKQVDKVFLEVPMFLHDQGTWVEITKAQATDLVHRLQTEGRGDLTAAVHHVDDTSCLVMGN